MKDHLNERIKFRQPFRPFAPIVRAERAPEIFEDFVESPFMLMACAVRKEWRDKIPAVTHYDGTARVQTLHQETNEALYELLLKFEERTGVPVLLNTSFNIRGEPIVETPLDALQCFLSTQIDHLYLDDRLISKKAGHRIIRPLKRGYRIASKMASQGTRFFQRELAKH